MGIRLPRSLTNDQQGEPPVVSIRSQRVQNDLSAMLVTFTFVYTLIKTFLLSLWSSFVS